ncbi:MAG: hypoxanthine phosphoribosyltransferase [candidate division WOR-3 bacterium]
MSKEYVEIFITEDEIKKKIDELAKILNEEYKDKKPVFIVILKGAFIFAANLITKLNFPLNVDFMIISSYEGEKTSSGKVRIEEDISIDIEGRDVVVVEDIIDTGLTYKHLKLKLLANSPKSLKLVTLLDKKCKRKVEENPDYSCFVIDDHFVVGYGLDYKQMYRNLPYIGILKEE